MGLSAGVVGPYPASATHNDVPHSRRPTAAAASRSASARYARWAGPCLGRRSPFTEVLETDDRADRPFLRLPHPRNGMSLSPSRIARLILPRLGQPSLYLPHKSANARRDGLLEVQRISPNAKRSWFLDQQVISGTPLPFPPPFPLPLPLPLARSDTDETKKIHTTDGSLLAFTPIDPLFLVIPLLVSLLARGGKPNEPRNERPFTATLALEQASGDGVRTDRFRPLDDLVLEASRAREYRLPEAFARAGKKGEEEEEEDGSQEEGEWMGSRDLVELCRLDCVRARISHACETKCKPPARVVVVVTTGNTYP